MTIIYKYQSLINNITNNRINYIYWGFGLSENPNAIHLLEQNIDKIDWESLSYNTNAIHLLEQNIEKINWDCLSGNPNAIQLLENNKDKIDWSYLSDNPNAIDLLENNIDKIDWMYLSRNENAIHLLEQNIDKIDWELLSENPNLFEFDYLAMSKERTKLIEQELLSKALHPSKVSKWLEYHIENGGTTWNFEY